MSSGTLPAHQTEVQSIPTQARVDRGGHIMSSVASRPRRS